MASCSISHHFKSLHYCLTNSVFWREPSHLFPMLSLAPERRELGSFDFHLLSVPRVKTHAGTCAFSVPVPTHWNPLPEHVKSSNSIPVVSFHHHLKTHLSFLRFHLINVDELCIVPGLCDCTTELDSFRG